MEFIVVWKCYSISFNSPQHTFQLISFRPVNETSTNETDTDIAMNDKNAGNETDVESEVPKCVHRQKRSNSMTLKSKH